MSRRQKILQCLIDNIEPVPNYILQSVEVGGVSGLRRLRELRDRGIKIEVRRKNKLMVRMVNGYLNLRELFIISY